MILASFLCRATFLQPQMAISRQIFQMGYRKLHFLIIKSQNSEKINKLNLLENTLSYLMPEYYRIQGCFVVTRAFSVFLKSAPVVSNFGLYGKQKLWPKHHYEVLFFEVIPNDTYQVEVNEVNEMNLKRVYISSSDGKVSKIPKISRFQSFRQFFRGL